MIMATGTIMATAITEPKATKPFPRRLRSPVLPPSPGGPSMWVRQCEVDAESEPLPIPAHIASNEEFIPPPQSPEQKQYEARVLAIADRESHRRGISRR